MGNPSLAESQLGYAYRNMWLWRALVVILLLFFLFIFTLNFWEAHENFKSVAKTESEVQRIIGITNKNYEQIQRNAETLHHCADCHAHPPSIKEQMKMQETQKH